MFSPNPYSPSTMDMGRRSPSITRSGQQRMARHLCTVFRTQPHHLLVVRHKSAQLFIVIVSCARRQISRTTSPPSASSVERAYRIAGVPSPVVTLSIATDKHTNTIRIRTAVSLWTAFIGATIGPTRFVVRARMMQNFMSKNRRQATGEPFTR